MAKGIIENIAITGISCAVPAQVRDADYWYEKFGQEAVDRFVKMTCVKRVCQSVQEQKASDLAYVAAINVLEKKKVPPESIGAIVFVSQGPDYILPATAYVLQHRLGVPRNSICLDINLGCSGYVYGVMIAASLMNSSNTDKALLLVGDTSTRGSSPDDKSAAMLFGDSGSATLLEKQPDCQSPLIYHMRSDGHRFKAIIKPAGAYRNLGMPKERTLWTVDGNVRSDYETYMNGVDVFAFSITEVPKLMKAFWQYTNTTADDYDCYAFHQANLAILNQIARKVKIPLEKMPVTLDNFGNTSVTSIPLTLSDTYGSETEGVTSVMMCGFGIGLSWGIVSAKIKKSDISPVLFSNDYFSEGYIIDD